jgi:hypothetical protein
MDLNKAFQVIESHEFAARVGVASQFSTFLWIATREDAVKRLAKCSGNRDLQAVLVRILRLAAQKGDQRYTNPWDTALTVYFWLLSSKNEDRLVRIAAESISGCNNLRWARRLIHSWETDSQQSKPSDSESVWDNGAAQFSISITNEGEGFYSDFLAEVLRKPVVLRTNVSSASTQTGQSLVDDGIVLSSRNLNRVIGVHEDCVANEKVIWPKAA